MAARGILLASCATGQLAQRGLRRSRLTIVAFYRPARVCTAAHLVCVLSPAQVHLNTPRASMDEMRVCYRWGATPGWDCKLVVW